jgi:undecaprenyl-diphosphatase
MHHSSHATYVAWYYAETFVLLEKPFMPAELTIFVANYLVFIEAAVGTLVLVYLLYRHPRMIIVRWGVAVCLMLVVAYIAAQVGGTLYNDPRPFVGHFRPLIPHAADNGFPSDHALLAASIVGAVALARLRWSLLVVLLAVLVEWARVGTGIHHSIDVIGSDVCVAIGFLIGVLAAPLVAQRLLPYVPDRLLDVVATRDERIA